MPASTSWYARFAKAAAHFCGRPRVITLAVALIVVWLIPGPLFGFSDTWQLVINTSTTNINAVVGTRTARRPERAPQSTATQAPFCAFRTKRARWS